MGLMMQTIELLGLLLLTSTRCGTTG